MYSRPKTTLLFCFLSLVLFFSCKSKTTSSADTDSESSKSQLPANTYTPPPTTENNYKTETAYYSDGNYCAVVRYNNENTGTRSMYILSIEVTNGKLTKLYFPNGGWLDETHFTPPLVSQNGFTEFVSDKGCNYEVLIQHLGFCTSNEQAVNNIPSSPSQSYSYDDNDDEGLSEEEIEEKQIGKETGVVVKRFDGCDYFLIETRKGLVVVEWMGDYDPDEGDKIRGELSSFGTKQYYVINKDRTTRLWLDDYGLDADDAIEKIREQCK